MPRCVHSDSAHRPPLRSFLPELDELCFAQALAPFASSALDCLFSHWLASEPVESAECIETGFQRRASYGSALRCLIELIQCPLEYRQRRDMIDLWARVALAMSRIRARAGMGRCSLGTMAMAICIVLVVDGRCQMRASHPRQQCSRSSKCSKLDHIYARCNILTLVYLLSGQIILFNTSSSKKDSLEPSYVCVHKADSSMTRGKGLRRSQHNAQKSSNNMPVVLPHIHSPIEQIVFQPLPPLQQQQQTHQELQGV